DCDLNCNISRHASVRGLFDKDFKPVEFYGKDALVRYVKVLDGPSGSDMYIYVPIVATFIRKE
ncbi:MAG: hypothetical protein II915_03445, partial [Eubacterium sp.]|nr:hypothetical protein [Eubacterium sp.]